MSVAHEREIHSVALRTDILVTELSRLTLGAEAPRGLKKEEEVVDPMYIFVGRERAVYREVRGEGY